MDELIGIGIFSLLYLFLAYLAFTVSILFGIVVLLLIAPILFVLFGVLGILK